VVGTEKMVEMQDASNRILYETVSQIYAQAAELSTDEQAARIVLSSLATNIGILLAQIPDEYRSAYIDITQKVIDASLVKAMQNVSQLIYGQIGHG